MVDLLNHLPRDSAVVAIESPASVWSQTDHLLAAMLDQMRLSAWSGKGHRPVRVPRPGDKQNDKIGSASLTVPELRAKLGMDKRG